jgi:predicted GNAT family N-acyltransferase/ADP-ribose pyrophosphatase YjhB (NUDIX family)
VTPPGSPSSGSRPSPSPRSARLDELDPATLYALLRLRVDAFVVEQRCTYPELDGRDLEPGAVHCWIEEEGQVLAYARVLRETDGSRVGRVVTAPAARGRGLAATLIRHALGHAARPVVLDAQSHLVPLYRRLGFSDDGPDFLEDGIPHTPMRLHDDADPAAADSPASGPTEPAEPPGPTEPRKPPGPTEPRLLDWGRRLAAVAQNGLHYTEPAAFDHRRYTQVRDVAAEILAAAHAGTPLRTVQRLLEGEEGYATPKIDVRGVVAREGRLLLVREVDDDGWTLPGGWADPTDAPRLAVEREVREEAGLAVRATKLLACFDRSRHGALPPYPFRVWKLFFRCEPLQPGAEALHDGQETAEAGWFPPDALPPLSLGRIMPAQLARVALHLADPHRPADFD